MSSRFSAEALIGDTELKLTNQIEVNVAFKRRENRSTWAKTPRCRAENQQIQPTYDAESGNRTRATLVGGEWSLFTVSSLLPWRGWSYFFPFCPRHTPVIALT